MRPRLSYKALCVPMYVCEGDAGGEEVCVGKAMYDRYHHRYG